MNYNLELQKIELKLKTVTRPEDRINLLKQGIQIADAHNDLDWGFDLRLDLIAEEVSTSQCVESFSAFSWILNTRDENPDLFEESEFLWEYKWMANASYRNASVSKEQIEGILEDLKVRMQRSGYSLRGYYSVLIAWNRFLGEKEKVDELIELREKELKDDMSHCPACELDTRVEVELEKGNTEEALALAQDLISRKLTCAHMPFATFSELAYHLNKAEDQRASDFFDRACEELQTMDESDSSIVATLSLLINYLISQDREKAFSFFEKYSRWEIQAEDSIKYTFSKNVFRLFSGEGNRKLQLDSKHPLYNELQEYKEQSLFQYYYDQAYQLAQRFDHRNGTSAFMESLEKEKTRISA